jgi:hypothetical protein
MTRIQLDTAQVMQEGGSVFLTMSAEHNALQPYIKMEPHTAHNIAQALLHAAAMAMDARDMMDGTHD